MKTWLPLLLVLLITGTPRIDAARIQNGVIIQKIGWTYVFVFPTSVGRMKVTDNPAGMISVGKNIQVAYALKIIRGGSARFIGFYGASMPEPKLSVINAGQFFGFLVKDKKQPQLQMYISPTFMAESKKTINVREKIAQQGNLNVTLVKEKDGTFRVTRVILD